MLMADMSASQRGSVQEAYRWELPEAAELLELVPMLWPGLECDHAMALVRMPDGMVTLNVLGEEWRPCDSSPRALLEARIDAYEQAIDETRRFLEIARGWLEPIAPWGSGNVFRDLGLPDPDGDPSYRSN
ncbi:MAG: hypothetical protein KF849_15320 [Rhizobiaceae bacterium]|nr:hypothetical protein [Rhizobiaceae bacterium]